MAIKARGGVEGLFVDFLYVKELLETNKKKKTVSKSDLPFES